MSTDYWRTLLDAAKVDLCPAESGAVSDRIDGLLDNLDGPPGGVAPPAKE